MGPIDKFNGFKGAHSMVGELAIKFDARVIQWVQMRGITAENHPNGNLPKKPAVLFASIFKGVRKNGKKIADFPNAPL